MTDRQLIGEYILQSIKYNSKVEIKLSYSDEIIKGLVADKDVFSQDHNEIKYVLYPYQKKEPPKNITIYFLKEKSAPEEFRRIKVQDILCIKKLND